MKTVLSASLVLVCVVGDALGEDWPRWRGPRLNGISTEKNWNANWSSDGPRQAWDARVGKGYSSFAVANNRVYTQGNTSNQDSIFCFDASTGRQLWKHTYAEPLAPRSYQGGTSATPVVDAGKVYTLAKSGLVHCLDAATGTVAWKLNVLTATNAKKPTWGVGSSPLILGNYLFLNAGSMGNTTALAMFSQKAVIGVNAASGALLWQFPWKTSYDINAADPVVNGQDIFVSSGYGSGGALLRLTGSGPRQVWKTRLSVLNSTVPC